jgi:hypothetical protein
MSSSNFEKCSDDPCGRQVTLEAPRLELLSRASRYGDLEAWAVFKQGLEESVLSWLHDHPGSEAACRVQSKRHFVALAFERLWQAIVQRRVACESLSGVLVYLRVSLNGAILDELRVSSGPGAVSSIWSNVENVSDKCKVWERLQALLSSEREQRLAYLLYHCGLEPAEIVRYCPQEWGNIQEVIRLRRTIFMQLMKGLNCEGLSLTGQPFV